jgi:formylglycine-generating enzyme required for sulfatase activity
LDWLASYANPCDNCADLIDATNRAFRGGYFYSVDSATRSTNRFFSVPGYHSDSVGARCARNSL